MKLVLVFCTLLLVIASQCSVTYGAEGPNLSEESLVAEKIAGGFESPTTFAFIAPNDILVLEKDKGTVLRILNGEILSEPLLNVNVANQVERGLLGIDVSENVLDNKTYVFLYYTEAETRTQKTMIEPTKKTITGIRSKLIVATMVNQ